MLAEDAGIQQHAQRFSGADGLGHVVVRSLEGGDLQRKAGKAAFNGLPMSLRND
jgi:hypothetical protein